MKTVKQEPVNKLLQTPRQAQDYECYRCEGSNHKPSDCKFRALTCRNCQKKGHIAKVFRSKTKSIKTVEDEAEVDYEDLLNAPTGRIPPLEVQVLIDSCDVQMEIDTGALRSIMCESLFRSIWPKRKLQASKVKLQTYSKEPLNIVGALQVHVEYDGQTAQLTLIIVKGDGPTLLGRDWLSAIRLDWPQIHYASSSKLQALLSKYEDVFRDEL